MYVMENQLFMSAQSVANIANNPFLVVVEEQMRNAKGSAVLFVLCSATFLGKSYYHVFPGSPRCRLLRHSALKNNRQFLCADNSFASHFLRFLGSFPL